MQQALHKARAHSQSQRASAQMAVVEEKMCRLCWGDEDDGPLVQPCACRGSVKWIHKACLERWRRTNSRQDAAYRCGQCMDQNLGSLLYAKDDLAAGAAEPLYREALQTRRETLGSRHPDTLSFF